MNLARLTKYAKTLDRGVAEAIAITSERINKKKEIKEFVILQQLIESDQELLARINRWMLSQQKHKIFTLLKQAEHITKIKGLATSTFLSSKKIKKIVVLLDENIQAQKKAVHKQDLKKFQELLTKQASLVAKFLKIEQNAHAQASEIKKYLRAIKSQAYNYAPIANTLGAYTVGVATEIMIDTNVITDSGTKLLPPKHMKKIAKVCLEAYEGIAEMTSSDFGTISLAASVLVIAGLVTLLIKKPNHKDIHFVKALA